MAYFIDALEPCQGRQLCAAHSPSQTHRQMSPLVVNVLQQDGYGKSSRVLFMMAIRSYCTLFLTSLVIASCFYQSYGLKSVGTTGKCEPRDCSEPVSMLDFEPELTATLVVLLFRSFTF